MSTARKNYYKILGISHTSTLDEVKKAFRKLALQAHSDKHQDDKKIEQDEKFKLLSEAYDALRDPDKRARYDAQFTDAVKDTPAAEPRREAPRPPINPQPDNLSAALSSTEKLFVRLLEISKARNGGIAGKEFFDLLNVLFDHPDDAARIMEDLLRNANESFRSAAIALAELYETGRRLEPASVLPSPETPSETQSGFSAALVNASDRGTHIALENKEVSVLKVDALLDTLFNKYAEVHSWMKSPKGGIDFPVYANCSVWLAHKYLKRINDPAVATDNPNVEPRMMLPSVFFEMHEYFDKYGLGKESNFHCIFRKKEGSSALALPTAALRAIEPPKDIRAPAKAVEAKTTPILAIENKMPQTPLQQLQTLQGQMNRSGMEQMGMLIGEIISIINSNYSESTKDQTKINKGRKIAESVCASIISYTESPSSMYHTLSTAWLKPNNLVYLALDVQTGIRFLSSRSGVIDNIIKKINVINIHPRKDADHTPGLRRYGPPAPPQ